MSLDGFRSYMPTMLTLQCGDGNVVRVAGRQPHLAVDLRIIAATSQDLRSMVLERKFRADL
jgi:transcriptional regulator with GAF, ATPase, and Fis domain